MEDANQPTPVNYCLYARKSSESDERQAMSIDSQIKEMKELAKRDNLAIADIYKESHSAKASGARPIFNQLLFDIGEGRFNGILTWAPDRLSRNAGDLGMLVDLMDRGSLKQIKTYSQSFSNNPNEKFLLMILCSQAKLENDNRSINVKRGIRAKCEQGWRPGVAPLGYFNRAFGGVKDIIVDPDRAPIVQEAFRRVAENGDSGRTIKRWFDEVGFRSRQNRNVALSQVYLMLKNPFYTGRFRYPAKTGKWYQGKHPPLISQELFDQVQKQLTTTMKSEWGKKTLTFKGLFVCAGCGGNIIGEERYRKRKNKSPRRHVYYHCARELGQCKEPYISEEKLCQQILRYINFMNVAHPVSLKLTEKLSTSIEAYSKVKEEVLCEQDINPENVPLDIVSFARHILRNGTIREKRDLIKALGQPMYIHNRHLASLADGFNRPSEPHGYDLKQISGL